MTLGDAVRREGTGPQHYAMLPCTGDSATNTVLRAPDNKLDEIQFAIVLVPYDHRRLWWENHGTAEIGGRLVLVWWPFGCGQPIVMNGHFGLD